MMIERGLITEDQLAQALEVQRSSGGRVGEILVESGALSSFELARVLADHLGLQFTDLRTRLPDPVLATFLPEEVARRYDALAIARWDEHLVIAMANPTDIFALDDLQMVTGQPVIAAMAVKEDLRAAIDRVVPRVDRRDHGRRRHQRLQDDRRRGCPSGTRGQRGTHRQARRRADGSGHHRPGVGPPHPALLDAHHGSVPHRRRAARLLAGTARAPPARGEPREDSRRPRHRPEPHHARRPVLPRRSRDDPSTCASSRSRPPPANQ